MDWSNSLLPSLNNGDLSYSMDSEKTNKLDAIKRTRIPYQKEVNPLVVSNDTMVWISATLIICTRIEILFFRLYVSTKSITQ